MKAYSMMDWPCLFIILLSINKVYPRKACLRNCLSQEVKNQDIAYKSLVNLLKYLSWIIRNYLTNT